MAQNINNQTFVSNFEKRVKQFAEPALDKCRDDADTVWQEYLNKALLDIYYAQQSKVNEIQQGCFDFVSACYMNGSDAMTNAMQGLVAAQTTTLKPDATKLNKSLCDDYIKSCNNMFDGDIVAKYIDNRHDTDSLSSCRAVVQQCFDNYGGQNYENFYKPSSGLFDTGLAPTWFSLYEIFTNQQKPYYVCNDDTGTYTSIDLVFDDANGNRRDAATVCTDHGGAKYASECAKQLANIDACHDIVEEAFGGLDYYAYYYSPVGGVRPSWNIYTKYGYQTTTDSTVNYSRKLRPYGIASEVYNQIIDILQTQCRNLDGKFMIVQNLQKTEYSESYKDSNLCLATFDNEHSRYNHLYREYSIGKYVITDQQVLVNQQSLCTQGGLPQTNPNVSDPNVSEVISIDDGPIASTLTNVGQNNSFTDNLVQASYVQCDTTTNMPVRTYFQLKRENMCPYNYNNTVDVQSWGPCLCWENGGRRSNNGTSTRCLPTFPVEPLAYYNVRLSENGTISSQQQTNMHGKDNACVSLDGAQYITNIDPYETTTSFKIWDLGTPATQKTTLPTEQDWCTGSVDEQNRVMPFGIPAVNNNSSTNHWTLQCPAGTTRQSSSDYCCPNGYELYTLNDTAQTPRCKKQGTFVTPNSLHQDYSCDDDSWHAVTAHAAFNILYFCCDGNPSQAVNGMSCQVTGTHTRPAYLTFPAKKISNLYIDDLMNNQAFPQGN